MRYAHFAYIQTDFQRREFQGPSLRCHIRTRETYIVQAFSVGGEHPVQAVFLEQATNNGLGFVRDPPDHVFGTAEKARNFGRH